MSDVQDERARTLLRWGAAAQVWDMGWERVEEADADHRDRVERSLAEVNGVLEKVAGDCFEAELNECRGHRMVPCVNFRAGGCIGEDYRTALEAQGKAWVDTKIVLYGEVVGTLGAPRSLGTRTLPTGNVGGFERWRCKVVVDVMAGFKPEISVWLHNGAGQGRSREFLADWCNADCVAGVLDLTAKVHQRLLGFAAVERQRLGLWHAICSQPVEGIVWHGDGMNRGHMLTERGMWLWDQWIGVDIRGCGADFLVGFLLNQNGCKIVAGTTVVSGTWDEWACESTKLQVVQPLCEFLGQKQLELVSC